MANRRKKQKCPSKRTLNRISRASKHYANVIADIIRQASDVLQGTNTREKERESERAANANISNAHAKLTTNSLKLALYFRETASLQTFASFPMRALVAKATLLAIGPSKSALASSFSSLLVLLFFFSFLRSSTYLFLSFSLSLAWRLLYFLS